MSWTWAPRMSWMCAPKMSRSWAPKMSSSASPFPCKHALPRTAPIACFRLRDHLPAASRRPRPDRPCRLHLSNQKVLRQNSRDSRASADTEVHEASRAAMCSQPVKNDRATLFRPPCCPVLLVFLRCRGQRRGRTQKYPKYTRTIYTNIHEYTRIRRGCRNTQAPVHHHFSRTHRS